MIEGEIDELTKKLTLEFIPLDEKEFREIEVDITGIVSNEELIQKINDIEFSENNYIKIILIGQRQLEVDASNILKQLANPNILKIKDKTRIEVNLEMLASQKTLKGIFVRTLLEKQKAEPENKDKIQKAIEIGLSSF